ncbi:MAG: hypothetical protein ACYDHH_17060 [Solirubrobacteraceae bacterium]
MAVAAALVAAALVIVLVALLGGSSGGKIAGMPANVASQVGPSPTIVTLRGPSVLALLSPPGVDQLARLEGQLAGLPGVRVEYGPVRWLRAQIATIAAAVAAHTTAKVSRAALLVRYGATSGLTIDDQSLATTLAFGAGIDPLRTLAWLFPDPSSARIYLRTTAGASVRRIRVAVFGLVNSGGLLGVNANVSGGGG